ncbi:hypothetical protein [Salinarimonas sp.]|uniref:hypothetical protein n=1 Tax=Salinarimonas sp. TaxID=2766526 RepID=UPI0032D92B16
MAEWTDSRFPSDHDLRAAIDAARRRLAQGGDTREIGGGPLPSMPYVLGPDGVKRLRIKPSVIERALKAAGRSA